MNSFKNNFATYSTSKMPTLKSYLYYYKYMGVNTESQSIEVIKIKNRLTNYFKELFNFQHVYYNANSSNSILQLLIMFKKLYPNNSLIISKDCHSIWISYAKLLDIPYKDYRMSQLEKLSNTDLFESLKVKLIILSGGNTTTGYIGNLNKIFDNELLKDYHFTIDFAIGGLPAYYLNLFDFKSIKYNNLRSIIISLHKYGLVVPSASVLLTNGYFWEISFNYLAHYQNLQSLSISKPMAPLAAFYSLIESNFDFKKEFERLIKLKHYAITLLMALPKLNLELIPTPLPIISFICRDCYSTSKLKQIVTLLDLKGYQIAETDENFRIVLRSEHNKKQIKNLFNLIKRFL